MPVHKILVPVANPEDPGIGVEFAFSLAQHLDATITLLHVVNEQSQASKQEGDERTGGVAVDGTTVGRGDHPAMATHIDGINELDVSVQLTVGEVTEFIESQLESYLLRAGFGNFPVAVSVVAGDPAERIPSIAHVGKFDVVVMEGVRTSRLAKVLFGSTLDTVEKNLEVPILMLQPNDVDNLNMASVPDAVIVPLDQEPDSEHVIEVAINLAEQIDARIEFVTAVSHALYVAHPASPLGAPITIATEAEQQDAEGYLQRFVHLAEGKGIPAGATVLTGDAVSVVQRIAQQFRNALIVTDLSERSGVTRLVLGKFSEDLMHRTSNPVMVVPSPVSAILD